MTGKELATCSVLAILFLYPYSSKHAGFSVVKGQSMTLSLQHILQDAVGENMLHAACRAHPGDQQRAGLHIMRYWQRSWQCNTQASPACMATLK